MTPEGHQTVGQGEQSKKKRKKKRKRKSKPDETEYEDEIIPGDPSTGTPTVILKGWGALRAFGKLDCDI